MAQIEGVLPEGARTLLVEDLATDGGSKLKFIQAIRAAGAQVADAFVVFHYGIFPESIGSLAAEGVRLHALATWWDVLRVARARAYFDVETLDEVERFLNDPKGWTASRA
jgi:orotate phosphoribosyltransferase